MKTSSAKAKGRRFQQWVRDKLLLAFPQFTDADISSTSMGASGMDVLLSSAARQLIPWAIEAKNQEKINIWSAWKQTESNIAPGLEPVLFFTRNKSPELAVVRAEYLIGLIKNG